jgi:hypothetical protein
LILYQNGSKGSNAGAILIGRQVPQRAVNSTWMSILSPTASDLLEGLHGL